jgi:predicted transcriptional regulator
MTQYTKWNQEQITKLRGLIEGGATYEKAATALGISDTSVYKACKKFAISQPKKESSVSRILELCVSPKGMSSVEISKAIGTGRFQINKHLKALTDAGKLHRAGICNFFRYFSTAEAASAYDAEIERERMQKLKARREKEKNNAPLLSQRRSEQRKRRAELAKQAKAAMPIAEPKPMIKSPEPVIAWNGNVKVVTIPTPPGRFDFTPPEGWRGQLTHDWMDRRSQGAGA